MVMMLVSTLIAGAAILYWSVTRRVTVWIDPNHQHLATLLLVSTNALEAQNSELYQAAIKAILYMMSKERWKRLEIEWRMRQAISIAKTDSTPELFEKLNCVAENIARVTVHSTKMLPWESRPHPQLTGPSS